MRTPASGIKWSMTFARESSKNTEPATPALAASIS